MSAALRSRTKSADLQQICEALACEVPHDCQELEIKSVCPSGLTNLLIAGLDINKLSTLITSTTCPATEINDIDWASASLPPIPSSYRWSESSQAYVMYEWSSLCDYTYALVSSVDETRSDHGSYSILLVFFSQFSPNKATVIVLEPRADVDISSTMDIGQILACPRENLLIVCLDEY